MAATAAEQVTLGVRTSTSIAALALCAASCGSEPPKPPQVFHGTSIEIADFEVNGDGIDRFASCPPPGDLGQEWFPPVPDWSPPPGAKNDTDPADVKPNLTGQTATERAIEDTRAAFRSCYHRGLVRDPTQFGHVAIVLRIGPNGRVLQTESYGACELQKEVVACMRGDAKALRFSPPPSGKDTIVIPVVFAPRGGTANGPSPNDAYTAAAYVALESLAPQLHECDKQARAEGRDVEAFGVFDLTVDERGNVTGANIDPWGGDKDLLACGAEVMQKLKLPPPAGGKGKVLTRVTFNPRAGTR